MSHSSLSWGPKYPKRGSHGASDVSDGLPCSDKCLTAAENFWKQILVGPNTSDIRLWWVFKCLTVGRQMSEMRPWWGRQMSRMEFFRIFFDFLHNGPDQRTTTEDREVAKIFEELLEDAGTAQVYLRN